MAKLRIPFNEAISEPKLLAPWFRELSLQQQVALKAMYGCTLSNDVRTPDGQWGELDIWAQLQGFGTYDELGYLVAVDPVPYIPQEYPEAWMAIGVRAGKALALDTTV